MKVDVDRHGVSSPYLCEHSIRVLQGEVGFRYCCVGIIIEVVDGVVSDAVEEGRGMPWLMASGTGQTENEILIVWSPCRLDDAESVLAIFGGIIQSAKHPILGRLKL